MSKETLSVRVDRRLGHRRKGRRVDLTPERTDRGEVEGLRVPLLSPVGVRFLPFVFQRKEWCSDPHPLYCRAGRVSQTGFLSDTEKGGDGRTE